MMSETTESLERRDLDIHTHLLHAAFYGAWIVLKSSIMVALPVGQYDQYIASGGGREESQRCHVSVPISKAERKRVRSYEDTMEVYDTSVPVF
jgi:hypothetical protein